MDSILSERDEYIVQDERRECDCWPGRPRPCSSFRTLEKAAAEARAWQAAGIPAGIVRIAPTQVRRVIPEDAWPADAR